MEIPINLLYSKDHEWVKIENNVATIGITHFAQSELGDIVYVDVPTIGKNIQAQEIFGTVEAVKTVSDLFMPICGTILALNAHLDKSPELVNTDPYGEGWMIQVQLSDNYDTKHLLSSEAYKNLIK